MKPAVAIATPDQASDGELARRIVSRDALAFEVLMRRQGFLHGENLPHPFFDALVKDGNRFALLLLRQLQRGPAEFFHHGRPASLVVLDGLLQALDGPLLHPRDLGPGIL